MTESLKQWNIDANGFIVGLCLHDGLLTGIKVENNTVILWVTNALAESLRLELRHSVALLLNGFQLGNIIAEAWLLKLDNRSLSILSKCFAHLQDEKKARAEADKLFKAWPELWVLHLEPTYGGEVIVAFESLQAFSCRAD